MYAPHVCPYHRLFLGVLSLFRLHIYVEPYVEPFCLISNSIDCFFNYYDVPLLTGCVLLHL